MKYFCRYIIENIQDHEYYTVFQNKATKRSIKKSPEGKTKNMIFYIMTAGFPQSWKSKGKNLVMEKSWKMGAQNKVMEIQNGHGKVMEFLANHA